ncbi:FG-GAP-like repeat-containing protein [Labrys wisconsinensis]|uniref:YD repeat-containing protein n=1 Tax=Labrys wisconsinensis TaxID=425677 RepID=A0ABU0JGX1_9HYPH|nr:FG-GAP-like repeat-containing protein [Labrys wisconsinensis]MDQ0473538.1 YD repeat-containing protein [Labrys wisconsinensis]
MSVACAALLAALAVGAQGNWGVGGALAQEPVAGGPQVPVSDPVQTSESSPAQSPDPSPSAEMDVSTDEAATKEGGPEASEDPAQSDPVVAAAAPPPEDDPNSQTSQLSGISSKDEPPASSGSFTQAVPIVLPAFHGLEPKLKLVYDSLAGARAGGYWAGFTGVGFRLGGLSEITRTNRGGGAPRFSMNDVYALDGEEFVACGGTAGAASDACGAPDAGVSYYVTRVESFLRVKFSGNLWSITQRDGTVATYKPVSTWGSLDPHPDLQKLGTSTRWLLASLKDTNDNVVIYDYTCPKVPVCWPATIKYNGITITFYHEQAPAGARMTLATGAAPPVDIDQTVVAPRVLATLDRRLTAIDIQSGDSQAGASRIRAYDLAYDQSAATGYSRLIAVKLYGKDASIDTAGHVSGPTALPATTFGYQGASFYQGTPAQLATSTRTSPITLKQRLLGDANSDQLPDAYEFDTSAPPPPRNECVYIGSRYKLELNSVAVQPTPDLGRCYIPSSEWTMFLADMDGDGRNDILAYDLPKPPHGRGMASVFLNNPDLKLGRSATVVDLVPESDRAVGVKIIGALEVNGDGNQDIMRSDGRFYGLAKDGTPIRFPFVSPVTVTGRQSLLDINGDGLTDLAEVGLVVIDSGPIFGGETKIQVNFALSTGSGFTSQQVVYFPGKVLLKEDICKGIKYGQANIRPADVNGDGKMDFVLLEQDTATTVNVGVLLSTGSGFVHQIWAQHVPAHYGLDQGAQCGSSLVVGDIDGDGRTDVVVNNTWGSSTLLRSTGEGFEATGLNFAAYALMDLDGDGRDDILPNGDDKWRPAGTFVSVTRPFPDLMTSVRGPLGGTLTVAYQPSSGVVHGPMPGVLQQIKSLTRNDGRGGVGVTTYSFAGGQYSAAERRFFGYRTATVDLPFNAGEAVCPRKIYTCRQDAASAGKLETLEETTTEGAPILRRQLETWSVKTTAGLQPSWPPASGTVPALTLPYTAYNAASESQAIFSEKVTTGGGGGSGSGGVIGGPPQTTWNVIATRRSRVERAYGQFGNMVGLIEHGDADQLGDERYTLTEFKPNAVDYIVSAPKRIRTYAGTTSAGTLLADQVIYYDGSTNLEAVPTKGNVTQTGRRSQASANWYLAKTEYDSYGNKTAVIDELGNRTETDYDATYHLLPVEVRNAKYATDPKQKVVTTYDLACRKPLTVTDMNGEVTAFTYDALCRLTEKKPPLNAFERYTYYSVGNPATQYVDLRKPGPTGTATIYTKTYLDGFGRIWKVLAQGPDTARVITTLTDYTARGNVARTSRPFYSGEKAQYTTAAYDALDRPVSATNPDGSASSTTYGYSSLSALSGFLTVTATDELGRRSIVHTDAFGRTVRQTRFLGTSEVNRSMVYDAMGRLTQLTDPAGNQWINTFDNMGRRTQVQDPDLGTWTYAYDGASNLTRQTDAKGQQVAFLYDPLNRVRSKIAHAELPANDPGRDTTTYAYDEGRTGFFNVGKMTTSTNAAATLTADYDVLGREVKKTLVVDGQTYVTTTVYDTGSRVTARSLPDGSSVGPITYDPAGWCRCPVSSPARPMTQPASPW